MPKFMIERSIPGAAELTRDQLTAISQSSCMAVTKTGVQIEWLESFVTSHKMYCVYMAPDAEIIRQHAELGGFPADSIAAIERMLDPTGDEFD